MFGTGMSVTRRLGAVAVPFVNPGSLFLEGDLGVWYDPVDLTTLWQDTAGTTSAELDADPVGRMDDLSGNGNNALQATDLDRPVVDLDTIPDSLFPINSNHHMTVGDGTALNFETFTCVMAFTESGSGNGRIVDTRGQGAIGSRPGVQIKDRNATSDIVIIEAANGQHWRWGDLVGQRIYTVRYSPNNGLFRSDGVQQTPLATSSTMGSIVGAGSNMLFTANNSVGSQSFAGKFFGMVYINRALSNGEIEDTEQWYADKLGIVI